MLQLYQAQQIIDVFLLGLHGKVTSLQHEHSIPCVCECFGVCVCVSYSVSYPVQDLQGPLYVRAALNPAA